MTEESLFTDLIFNGDSVLADSCVCACCHGFQLSSGAVQRDRLSWGWGAPTFIFSLMCFSGQTAAFMYSLRLMPIGFSTAARFDAGSFAGFSFFWIFESMCDCRAKMRQLILDVTSGIPAMIQSSCRFVLTWQNLGEGGISPCLLYCNNTEEWLRGNQPINKQMPPFLVALCPPKQFLVSWVKLARDGQGEGTLDGGWEGGAFMPSPFRKCSPIFCLSNWASVSELRRVQVWPSGLMRCGVSPGESRSSLKLPSSARLCHSVTLQIPPLPHRARILTYGAAFYSNII